MTPVRWTNHILQGIGNTRTCITGDPVPVELVVEEAELLVPPDDGAGHTVVRELGLRLLFIEVLQFRNLNSLCLLFRQIRILDYSLSF